MFINIFMSRCAYRFIHPKDQIFSHQSRFLLEYLQLSTYGGSQHRIRHKNAVGEKNLHRRLFLNKI